MRENSRRAESGGEEFGRPPPARGLGERSELPGVWGGGSEPQPKSHFGLKI